MIVLVCTTAVGRSGHTHVVGEAAAAARAGNPFSPNNSSAEPKPGGKPSQIQPLTRYLTHTHQQLNFDDVGVCVHRRETTHRPIAASPNHTDNLLDFTFLLFFSVCCFSALFSARLVCYALFHFFSPLLLFFLLLLICQLFPSLLFFFLSGTCCFPLDSLFFLLLLLLLLVVLRPFSHAPPRLLIARN